MTKQDAAAPIADSPVTGKFPFRRKRKHTLKAVEEVFKGKSRWRVAVYVAGKRVRRFFPSEQAAETFIEAQNVQASNLGERVKRVDGRLLEDAVTCESLLRPLNVPLLDAVRDYVAARGHLRAFPDATLGDAAARYGALLADRAHSWTVSEGAAKWLDSREDRDRSESYLVGARVRLKRFCKAFGTVSMADVSTAGIDGWVRGLKLGAQSQRNWLTVLSTMFAYALKQGRAPRNPVIGVERPEAIRPEAGILTPKELGKLLRHLPDDTVPYAVVCAFAGLRCEEALRLRWEDISFANGLITVRGGAAKKKQRRTTPITDNLRAWLEPLAETEGLICPLAAFTVRQYRMKSARAAAGLKEWPHNALRHSFCTYALQRTPDAAQVSLWAGNSPAVLLAHYRNVSGDPEAHKAWFALKPTTKRKRANVIQFAA